MTYLGIRLKVWNIFYRKLMQFWSITGRFLLVKIKGENL